MDKTEDLLHNWKLLRQLRDDALKERAKCPTDFSVTDIRRDVLLQLASSIDHLLSWSPPSTWKEDHLDNR
jgi:hypothetical protein